MLAEYIYSQSILSLYSRSVNSGKKYRTDTKDPGGCLSREYAFKSALPGLAPLGLQICTDNILPTSYKHLLVDKADIFIVDQLPYI